MNIAISAGHDLTADTALEIIRSGGNAFDAAIASYLVAFVAEPCMASAGGGAFANVQPALGKNVVFDFFCQTPKIKRPQDEIDFVPIEVDFGDDKEIFQVGLGSMAVPGSIAGVFALHKHFGSIPMKTLVEPAIIAAKEGVVLNEFQGLDLQLLKGIFERATSVRDVFFNKDGRIKDVGERVSMPNMADFLDYMSREGSDAFYKGEVANSIVQACANNGGHITHDDLASFKVIVREPLLFPFRNRFISTNPLPSLGGSLIRIGMDSINQHRVSNSRMESDYLSQLTDALVAMSTAPRSPGGLANLLNGYESDWSNTDGTNKRGSTSHFNIIDKKGNAVALTTTIGEGSSYFVEGTDIHMNNMLGEAALMPNGFHSWDCNQRLSSMMSPTLVYDQNNKLEVVLGTGGAGRIPGAILQVLHNLIDYKLPVYDAVNNARMHVENGKLHIEGSYHADVPEGYHELEIKNWNDLSLFFGGVHTLLRRGKAIYAAADERRDGVIRVVDT